MNQERGIMIRKAFEKKVDSCFEQYKAEWLSMNSAELIVNCEQISSIIRTAAVLPEIVSDEEAAYLMRFKNPIAVISDMWIEQNLADTPPDEAQLSAIVSRAVSERNAEAEYELEPGYIPG